MTLREYRKKYNLTQKAIADLVGVSMLAITRYECGTRMPTADVMRTIADVTDGKVTPNDFVLSPTKN